MRKPIQLALILVLALQWTACSTNKAFVKYDDFDPTFKLHEGAVNGKSLGPVRGNEGGAIWNNCTEKAGDSLRVMIADARAKGANAIGNIKWYATGDATPSCKKGWGYLIVWPFILTPLFMSTEVEGIAYKTDGSMKKSASLIILPKSRADDEAVVQKLLTGT